MISLDWEQAFATGHVLAATSALLVGAGVLLMPAGHTVAIRTSGSADFGAHCGDCPLRHRCTRAKDGRHLTISPNDDELVYGRRAWADPIFQDHYRQHRPMVERAIAWLVSHGNRKVHYRGVERNNDWLATRAAALNLRRLINLGLDRTDTTWTIAG